MGFDVSNMTNPASVKNYDDKGDFSFRFENDYMQWLAHCEKKFDVLDYQYKRNTEKKYSLSDIIVDRITGPFKQDVTMILSGPKGSGKSYTSLSMAYTVAKKVAEKKDNDESKWQKYFDLERTVAIMSAADVYTVMKNMEDQNVIILDDVGVSMNSRKFASAGNNMMNDIFQTARTKQCFTILSSPASFIIDKVPRSLATWQATIAQSNHELGYNLLRITGNVALSNGKVLNPYLRGGASRNRITRWIIHKPPQFLADAYDELRSIKTAELIESRGEELLEMEQNKGKSSRERKAEQYREKLKEVNDLIGTGDFTLKEALKKVGISKYIYDQYNETDLEDEEFF